MPHNQSPADFDLHAALAALHADSYGWALACCGRDRAEAEDALQRAYLRILEGRARFKGSAQFRTFVFGVIRMTAREERRGWRLHLFNATSPGRDLVDPEPAPDTETFTRERRTQLLNSLAQLSVRQREVVELVFYHEMTIEEAAAVMHVRIGSARTHYERAKTRLRALLPREIWQDG